MAKTQTLSKTDVESSVQSQNLRPHKVVLLNDEDHTYNYVVEMLMKCVGLSRSKAFQCAVEVDTCGRTIVWNGSEEKCEEKAQKINQYGIDHRLDRSLSSMKAIVEE